MPVYRKLSPALAWPTALTRIATVSAHSSITHLTGNDEARLSSRAVGMTNAAGKKLEDDADSPDVYGTLIDRHTAVTRALRRSRAHHSRRSRNSETIHGKPTHCAITCPAHASNIAVLHARVQSRLDSSTVSSRTFLRNFAQACLTNQMEPAHFQIIRDSRRHTCCSGCSPPVEHKARPTRHTRHHSSCQT